MSSFFAIDDIIRELISIQIASWLDQLIATRPRQRSAKLASPRQLDHLFQSDLFESDICSKLLLSKQNIGTTITSDNSARILETPVNSTLFNGTSATHTFTTKILYLTSTEPIKYRSYPYSRPIPPTKHPLTPPSLSQSIARRWTKHQEV